MAGRWQAAPAIPKVVFVLAVVVCCRRHYWWLSRTWEGAGNDLNEMEQQQECPTWVRSGRPLIQRRRMACPWPAAPAIPTAVFIVTVVLFVVAFLVFLVFVFLFLLFFLLVLLLNMISFCRYP